MKIQIMSDIHLEFAPYEVPQDLSLQSRDLLIVAGDIGIGDMSKSFLEAQAKLSPVIFVMGNHEYYEQAWDPFRIQMQRMADSIPGVHLLENSSVILNGVRFLGTTLWSNFSQGDRSSMQTAERGMTDYQLISKDQQPIRARFILEVHTQAVKWLTDQLSQPFSGPTVVITHHLPAFTSVPEDFKNNDLRFAYASNLFSLILSKAPEVWIHGHVHTSFDYRIGKTRILCNPRGYIPKQPNLRFNPQCIIDLP
jgi:predicted phosphodiesterase